MWSNVEYYLNDSVNNFNINNNEAGHFDGSFFIFLEELI